MNALKQDTLLGEEQRTNNSINTSVSATAGWGKCSRCGKALKDPVSVMRGMGPICWALAKGEIFEHDMDAPEEEWTRRDHVLRRGGEIDLGVNWRYIDHNPEMALQIPQNMRVSLRFANGVFEAYGAISGWGEEREIVFGQAADVRTAYRLAINAGPQSEAVSYRVQRERQRAFRLNKEPKRPRLVS